jgi:hypothetical protein
MRDAALEIAAALAALAGLVHAVLGETRVFPRATIERSGIALLAVAPTFAGDGPRRWIIFVSVAVYGSAAIGNAIATRGRHFGWMVLAAVVVLTLAGILEHDPEKWAPVFGRDHAPPTCSSEP